MKIKVTSNILSKDDLTGEYDITPSKTIREFTTSLGIRWDHDALVVVNEEIVNENYVLEENDHIYFLTPIVGG